MNRRTLLGRFVFGAAAVLGCGMAATKAEAAEVDSAPIFGPDMQWTGYVIRADYESGLGTWSDVSPAKIASRPAFLVRAGGVTGVERWCTEHLDPATGAGHWHPYGGPRTPRGDEIYADARIESRLAEGLPIERGTLTFEDMQADCAGRGCSLERHVWITKDGVVSYEHSNAAASETFTDDVDSGHLSRVDTWRRSLHEAAARQTDLGTQIAESRRLRGARPLFSTD